MTWWDGMEESEIVKIEQTPTSHLVINGREIEIHRCETDGAIVTHDRKNMKLHLGHKVKQPVCLTRHEIEAFNCGYIN